ncbi:MAG: DUF4197 domain-containing protein [Deltaproteobacteria bacterium]|nr:DUF4197 domain-containing protein [Deltaproteobacteria bacterium]
MHKPAASQLFVSLLFGFTLGCTELAALQIPIPGFPMAELDENTVAAGLRQALEVGTQRAASTLARTGGFSDDPLLRLALPSELRDIAGALRTIGFSSQVDELELSMNRAAEAAVAEATPVFASAIRSMTIADAFEILNGDESAATDYFRLRTTDALRTRFAPIAREGMRKAGLYRAYREIATLYQRAVPFTTMPAPDLESYVADQALAGLFSKIAKEEAKIRSEPAARTTELLRRVFGR